jgi:hypothetical protein
VRIGGSNSGDVMLAEVLIAELRTVVAVPLTVVLAHSNLLLGQDAFICEM